MKVFNKKITIQSKPYSLSEFTSEIKSVLLHSEIKEGILSIFCQHTSCSLVIMENADPSARYDLENFIKRLVPENDPQFTHTYEGPDDMPSHIKMALTRTSEMIPISNHNLMMGVWQGIFLWEHRSMPYSRNLFITIIGNT